MAASGHHSQAHRQGPDPLIGVEVNGKFRILEEVAAGGMGKIYRAEQLPLGRTVAVKVLHSKFTETPDDPAFRKRFFLEASILSKLQHPNIVTVFDYGRIETLADEAYFMAMEYLPGETLHRRLKRETVPGAETTITIVRQIAKGLREAHRQGVVHRDLKPSNVMLAIDESGEESVKILDFGLVKVLRDDSEELTKEGSFLGSPRYMSPEQIAHGRVDLRADIYSLGVILYQCLCGRPPFEAEHSVHILMAHLHTPVPSFAERSPGVVVPEPLGALALRCLSKQPDGRPASMDEFLQLLRQCELALGIETRPSAFTERSLAAPRPASATPAPPALSPPAPAPPAAATTTQPEGQPSAAPRRTLALVLGLLALSVLGLALGLLVRSNLTDRSRVPVATVPPPPPAPRAPTEYRLEIDSSPPAATVFESGQALGATPLVVTVVNAAVAAAPRRFEVRRAGHRTFTLSAGPSDQPAMRMVATLVPEAPAEPPSPVAAPTDPPRRRAPRPTRPSNPVDSDIRLHR